MQPPEIQKNPAHKTRLRSRRLGYFLRLARNRRPGVRAKPVLAEFPPAADGPGAAATPVRIFIGDEPGQARAERTLVWSILKHRAPDRAYRIYLMKDLAGFDRRLWKTGFTNYRYAIPDFAGGEGRAIYNDVDQIYLADPAELFDRPLGDAGVLDVDGRDSSVMVIDCARMASVWPADLARDGAARHREYRALRDAEDLWGPIPAAWNVRDGAYRPGESKLLHFTTLHTQPWRPFADELRYDDHRDAEVWDHLEREADLAGFTVFTAARPTGEFLSLVQQRRAGPQLRIADGLARQVADDVGRFGAVSALTFEVGALSGRLATALEHAGAPLTGRFDIFGPQPPAAYADAALSLESLFRLPEDDVPWLLDALFRAAGKLVYVAVACYDSGSDSAAATGAACIQPPAWWQGQLAAAARRTPGIAWALHCRTRPSLWPGRFFQG